MMQYDTIEELMLELSLYPNRKLDILKDCARDWYGHGWFIVAKDGNCALFDKHGELDDIRKMHVIGESMIPKDIKKINIPDGVDDIGIDAFRDSSIKEVSIPESVTNIGSSAFFKCIELNGIDLPSNVTILYDSTFSFCSSLKYANLPSRLQHLGDFEFYSCISLKHIEIPSTVTYVGYEAFEQCRGIEVVFKGKTFQQVKSMKNYPFGIKDDTKILCER